MGNQKGCLPINALAGAPWSRRAASHTCTITHQEHSGDGGHVAPPPGPRPPSSQPFDPCSSAMSPLPAREAADLIVMVTGAGVLRPVRVLAVSCPYLTPGKAPAREQDSTSLSDSSSSCDDVYTDWSLYYTICSKNKCPDQQKKTKKKLFHTFKATQK